MLQATFYQQSLDEVDPDEIGLGPACFERRLRDIVHKLVDVSDFDGFYAEGGTASRCPLQLIAAELLKYRYDLSDRELIARCTRDLGFRYAIGLRKGEAPPGTATLTRFRAKLRQLKGDDFVWRRILDLVVDQGLLTDTELQVLDSTNTHCRGAVTDTFNLVAAAIRKVLRCVAPCLKRDASDLAREWGLERYMARSIKGQVAIDWSDKAAQSALITEEIEHAVKLVERLSELGITFPAEVQEATRLLLRVALQDVEQQEGGGFQIARGTAPNRIISMTDTEARHGRKSSSKVISGFKFHVIGTIESQFVTGIVVTDAGTHDAKPTAALIRQTEQHQLKPAEALGDGAYGSGENVRRAAEMGVAILTKMASPSHVGSIPKRAFTIDIEGQRVTCPAGATTTKHSLVKDPAGSNERVAKYLFDKATCQACPLRMQCSSKTAKGGARAVTLSVHEPELQRIKAFNQSERAPRLLRRRSAIERLISHLVRMGMRQARFFGMAKVQAQAFMTAAAYNLQRMFTLTAGRAAP